MWSSVMVRRLEHNCWQRETLFELNFLPNKKPSTSIQFERSNSNGKHYNLGEFCYVSPFLCLCFMLLRFQLVQLSFERVVIFLLVGVSLSIISLYLHRLIQLQAGYLCLSLPLSHPIPTMSTNHFFLFVLFIVCASQPARNLREHLFLLENVPSRCVLSDHVFVSSLSLFPAQCRPCPTWSSWLCMCMCVVYVPARADVSNMWTNKQDRDSFGCDQVVHIASLCFDITARWCDMDNNSREFSHRIVTIFLLVSRPPKISRPVAPITGSVAQLIR